MAFEMFRQFVSSGKKYFGAKPEVPTLPTLGEVGKTGAAANLAAVPQLQTLASGVNRFNEAEIRRMMESTLPGYFGSLAAAGDVAGSLARGEVPEDVARQVERRGATRALTGGYAGSTLGRNLTLRDLGLTSLEATGEGQRRLLGLGAFGRQLFPTYDYTTMFFSPAQMLDYTQSQFQRDLLAAKVAAAPDPVARGRAEQEMALFGMIMSAYSGGPGYTPQRYDPLSGGGAPNTYPSGAADFYGRSPYLSAPQVDTRPYYGPGGGPGQGPPFAPETNPAYGPGF